MRPAPEVPLLHHTNEKTGDREVWQCGALHDMGPHCIFYVTRWSPEAHALAQEPVQQDHERQHKVGAR